MSFRYKTIIGVAVIEAILLVILIWNALVFLRSSNEEQLIKRADTSAKLLATMAQDAVIATDLASLESLLNEVMQNSGIAYVRIYDTQRLLTSVGDQNVLAKDTQRLLASAGDQNVLAKKFRSDQRFDDVDDGIFDIAAEITEAGFQFGHVEIGIPTHQFDHFYSAAKRKISIIALLEMALTALFSFVLGTYLVTQLKGLQEASKRISEGELGYQINVSGSDELAVTATTFNSMSHQLKNLLDEIHRKNKELRGEVKEHQRTGDALRKSEEKFRGIIENLMDVYFETTLDGTINFCSPSGAVISGYSMDELIGNKVDMLYYNPQDREGLLNEIRDKGKTRGFELLFKKKDGELYDVSMNADIFYDEEGRPSGLRGTIRDITQQKIVMEQLHRSKKMESLGLMAGGIAHDLNNILSGVVSYPELLLLQLPEDSPLRDPIETIQDSGKRAADVVAELLTVTRGIATGKEVENLNAIIAEYLHSGEHRDLGQNHSGVVFTTKLDPELLNISCSSAHMKKILMNLVKNASEAVVDHGEVTIKTSNIYLDENLDGYENLKKGEYVLLTISDTGAGIPEGDIDKIFEPFFSSKKLGRSGTGLGLAVVWNTVQEHDGYINVTSSEKGTTFDLYFPVTRDEMRHEEVVPLEDYIGNGEKILVVDDEKNQRKIASGMLQKLGYSVETVSSGDEAISYLKEHSIDLIVLDMIMPEMNGRETYEKVSQIHPHQKAILASGYSESEDVIITQNLGAGKYIKKPYTLEKIGVAVRDELKRQQS